LACQSPSFGVCPPVLGAFFVGLGVKSDGFAGAADLLRDGGLQHASFQGRA
jgi:hypothetical protein